MTDNYTKIVQQNLKKLYADLPGDLAANLPAEQEGDRFTFTAFGSTCRIEPGGITFDAGKQSPILAVLD